MNAENPRFPLSRFMMIPFTDNWFIEIVELLFVNLQMFLDYIVLI